MSRLSIRPRPLDFNKKLPLVKSVKDLEDDDSSTNTRNSLLVRFTSEVDIEVQPVPTKKLAAEIPTPQYVIVDTYERDYSRTFVQPTSYLRARGVWADIGEFVEYDLDNEDEDWLHEYNRERKVLGAEKFEAILYKLEVLDHKARERAGLITSTLGSPIPPYLTFDGAVAALQSDSIMYGIFQSIYSYWKSKRERWQKPALRRLQPPPPATDTNPYNVFRPREKTHRLHTRRMQRRENNVQSFEKLRQVRQNLEQAKTILQALLLREEKKRDVTESEITLQRIQLKYKNETELFEDSLALPGFPPFPGKVVSSEEEMVDSDDVYNSGQHTQPLLQNMPFTDVKHGMISAETMRRESRRQTMSLPKVDDEPIMLFTKSLNTEKLAASGIIPPSDSPKPEGGFVRSCSSMFRGRMGRGGRIVFDRCNVLMNSADDGGEASYLQPIPQQIAYP